eukprot:1232613-Prymnesium_polylepis.1
MERTSAAGANLQPHETGSAAGPVLEFAERDFGFGIELEEHRRVPPIARLLTPTELAGTVKAR